MSVGVMMAYSTTAASNASADTNINFAEGQTPASLNNSDRAQMAAIKGFANQILAAKTSGGSANAYTFTSDSVAVIDTAYAAGMGFWFRANHTNSGASTLNVDGVGAKSIKKGGALSALVANDIVSGGIYGVFYQATGDCFVLVNPETGQTAAGNQPLDATLTALAALSWSSGNALVQFTAADTVSLTLTPSVSSISTSQGAAATTPSATFVNTTDNASVRVARFEGDRATPAANDESYNSWFMSDANGTQTEIARDMVRATAVTAGAMNSRRFFYICAAGTLQAELQLDANKLGPVANDGLTLGESGTGFADLFGASGFTFNFNAGNVVLTHGNSTATLEATTGSIVSKLTQVASVSGTLVAATHRNRELQLTGDITLPNATFAAGDWHVLRSDGTNRVINRGASVTMYVNGVDSATATLNARLVGGVLWDSASVCHITGPVT